MSKPSVFSRNASSLGIAICVSVLALMISGGCEQLGLPKPAEPATPAAATPAEATPDPTPPVPSFTEMAAQVTPEQQVADFLKLIGPAITDAELQKIAELSPANQAIQSLDLRGAQYSAAGLTVLQKLPNLKSLSLVGCPLQGNNWAPLAGLTQLESLNLDNSLMDDVSLEAVGALVNLKALDLTRTRITDNGFRHLVKLSKLEEIYCFNTSITGAGFEAFTGKYANSPLRIVGVSESQFGQFGFNHLDGKNSLEKIVAGNAGVSDVALQNLKGMKNMRSLWLSGNGISDQGLKILSTMTELEELDLGENALVSDFTLNKIKNFEKLKTLRVQTTSCTLKAVEELAQLLPNCDILFQDRKF